MTNLEIHYSFNTNRPSRYGMQFSFNETDAAPTAPSTGRGQVEDGITPSSVVIAADTTEALAFLRSHIGNTWPSWSLWYVMPDHGTDYYKLMPTALPRAVRKIDGHAAQLLCAVTPDGQYDAQVQF